MSKRNLNYFEKLEESLKKEANYPTIITYKWLSEQIQVSDNIAKKMLFAFSEQKGNAINTTYCISGFSKQDHNYYFSLVSKEKLEEKKKEFKDGYCIHVYSISLVNAKDFSQILWNSEKELLSGFSYDQLDKYLSSKKWSSIQGQPLTIKAGPKTIQKEPQIVPITNSSSAPIPEESVPKKASSILKKDSVSKMTSFFQQKSKEEKEAESNEIFADMKQIEMKDKKIEFMEEKKDTKKEGKIEAKLIEIKDKKDEKKSDIFKLTEKRIETKDKTNQKKKDKKKNKDEEQIVEIFEDKKIGKIDKKEKKHDGNKENKDENNKGNKDNSEKKNKKDSTTKTKNKKKIGNNEEKIQLLLNEEEDIQALPISKSKRKRIIEDSPPPSDEETSPKQKSKPKKRKINVLDPSTFNTSAFESILQIPKQQHSKITRKMVVTETYEDDDGFLVTRDVVKEVEGDESDEELMLDVEEEEKQKSCPQNKTKPQTKSNNPKIAPTQQANILSYFSKK